jgi:hypothetical protein
MSSALITRREYFNLFRGETTGFLLGNAGDVMKCEIDFELEIKSISSTSNPFTLEQVGSQIRISRLTGSFLNDGFITGATMVIIYAGSTTCTIDYASSNMIVATYSSVPPGDGSYPNVVTGSASMTITSASSVDGIELNYDLIKNSQLQANTLTSLIDGTTPTFKKSGVDCTVLTYIDIDQVGYLSGASVLSSKIKRMNWI